ncbi:MAG: dihydromonapterin reductase [Alishewanella sp. 32-51-5]|nr:MAG: dihydromonapterin reductase [Alishewanella sp. 32-51-5]
MQKEIIVITGAAQRVGLALALDLQQAGYQVVASYRSMRPGLEQLQAAGVMTLQCDLTDLPSLANFISQLQTLGPLRALIHNASDWRKDPPAQHQSLLQQLEAEAASFDYLQQVHARAPYLLNRALLPQLQQSEQADIIQLSDFALLMFNAGDGEEYKQHALQKSLLQTEPGAEEVVKAVNYILSSRYLTGRVLALDGGRHLNLP